MFLGFPLSQESPPQALSRVCTAKPREKQTPATIDSNSPPLVCMHGKVYNVPVLQLKPGMGKVRATCGPRIPFVRPADSWKRYSTCGPF